MTLFKTSFWTGLSTIIKLAANFIVAKVLAVYVGPAGFAIIGQFQNFVSMVLTFSGNMIQSGVIKYIAEFKNDQNEKTKILSTAFLICLIASFVIALFLFFLDHFFALILLKDINLSWLINVFSVALIFYVLNTLITSILNGEGRIKTLTVINMATSLMGLFLTYFLAKNMGLKGALLAQILSQSVVFVITLAVIVKIRFKWSDFMHGIDFRYLIKLLKFAGMAIFSALTVPVAQIVIRTYIGHTLSWQEAGYWQAVTRISDAYLLLVTSTLSVYYLPKLSALQGSFAIKKEMKKAYSAVFPIVVLMALCIFIFRKEIVLTLFSPEFIAMLPLFLFQLLGDIFKIGSWLIAYNMLAKAMTQLFICSEIIFSLSYCVLSIVFIRFFGLQGVTMAFCLNYLVYWGFMGIVFYRKFQDAA